MYHEVASPEAMQAIAGRIQLGYVVTTEQFESHLRTLRDLGAASVNLTQVTEWVRKGVPIPERSVVITFDDGFEGNYTTALPLLEKYGFTATFFVATNRIGDEAMMSWDQLREMSKRGMSIESHTASHPLLSTLSRDETRDELAVSRKVLERELGTHVKYISLPNGDSNGWYHELAVETGYAGGCGSQFGCNDRGADPYYLRRIAMKRSTTAQNITDYLLRDSFNYHLAMSKARIKRMVPALIGKRRYDRLYNALFGVAEQRKGRAE
jgi:peptidoglycan/xylan/chitin deacetylase (PgdA/CDA1 family)